MNLKELRIGVASMGRVPRIFADSIAANILGYLNLKADILPSLNHPEYAYDKKRLQYNAGTILNTLEPLSFDNYSKLIFILDVDLFVPILTHVYGEAKQGGSHALVSVNRLKKNSDGSLPPLDIVLERAAKIAIHELGHLFDLHHCTEENCVMSFLGTLKDQDKAPLYFCRYCSALLKAALRGGL